MHIKLGTYNFIVSLARDPGATASINLELGKRAIRKYQGRAKLMIKLII